MLNPEKVDAFNEEAAVKVVAAVFDDPYESTCGGVDIDGDLSRSGEKNAAGARGVAITPPLPVTLSDMSGEVDGDDDIVRAETEQRLIIDAPYGLERRRNREPFLSGRTTEPNLTIAGRNLACA